MMFRRPIRFVLRCGENSSEDEKIQKQQKTFGHGAAGRVVYCLCDNGDFDGDFVPVGYGAGLWAESLSAQSERLFSLGGA